MSGKEEVLAFFRLKGYRISGVSLDLQSLSCIVGVFVSVKDGSDRSVGYGMAIAAHIAEEVGGDVGVKVGADVTHNPSGGIARSLYPSSSSPSSRLSFSPFDPSRCAVTRLLAVLHLRLIVVGSLVVSGIPNQEGKLKSQESLGGKECPKISPSVLPAECQASSVVLIGTVAQVEVAIATVCLRSDPSPLPSILGVGGVAIDGGDVMSVSADTVAVASPCCKGLLKSSDRFYLSRVIDSISISVMYHHLARIYPMKCFYLDNCIL
ncbi:UNVERIFIED_CONTAM: hypothetical protein K2H54_002666 [Gekko kuhli]